MAKDEILNLWLTFVADDRQKGTFASEAGGDIYCFFCSAWDPGVYDKHDDDCIYALTKTYLAEVDQ